MKITIGLALIFFSNVATADILFEGYSKVLSGGVHIGYTVSRYEFDNAKKQFISTYYIKTNELGGNITESLKATCTESFAPINYQYTSVSGGQPKTIDASFTKDTINATVQSGKEVQKITNKYKEGAFLSTFLGYIMLKNPKGISTGLNFRYKAFAEEDASIADGSTDVKAMEVVNGIKAYKLINEFKGTRFISYVTEKGEALMTKSPANGIETQLVAQPSDATNGQSVNSTALKALFGAVPTGQINSLAEIHKSSPQNKLQNEDSSSSKSHNVPGGQGVYLKSKKVDTNKTDK